MSINIEQVSKTNHWLSAINDSNFEAYALSTFLYQYQNCQIYKDFVNALGIHPAAVSRLQDIPFLPISFFKSHSVTSGTFEPQAVFESSGTTGMQSSKHFIKDTALYEQSFRLAFEQFYGKPADFIFLCLLPSYLERGNSSLVYMANDLIRESGNEHSGFYLNEWALLAEHLELLKSGNKKVMLLGVTFALLDFAEQFPMDLQDVIVMETGGMKGRREEWTRTQVHDFLKEQWQLTNVHSEYGMTELLSQGYSKGQGIFEAATTMQLFVRDENDPFDIRKSGTGCLNIIDLANLHSCSFIATDDIVKLYADKCFEVMGRLDHSALRGCSLMVV